MLAMLSFMFNGAVSFAIAVFMLMIDTRWLSVLSKNFRDMKRCVIIIGFLTMMTDIACMYMEYKGLDPMLLGDSIIILFYLFDVVFISYTIILALNARTIYSKVVLLALVEGIFFLIFDICGFLLIPFEGATWSELHFQIFHKSLFFTILSTAVQITFVLLIVFLLFYLPFYMVKYQLANRHRNDFEMQHQLHGVTRLLIGAFLFLSTALFRYAFPSLISSFALMYFGIACYVFFADAVLRIGFQQAFIKGHNPDNHMPLNKQEVAPETEESAPVAVVEPGQMTGNELQVMNIDSPVSTPNAMPSETESTPNVPKNQFIQPEKPAVSEQKPVENNDLMVDAKTLKLSDRRKFMVILIQKWAERPSRPYADSDITVARVANELRMPDRQLSRLIHEEYNMTFNSWINSLRINEIKRILDEKPSSRVTTLFREMGFTDTSTATKIFKRFVGVTPTEYKQSHSGL